MQALDQNVTPATLILTRRTPRIHLMGPISGPIALSAMSDLISQSLRIWPDDAKFRSHTAVSSPLGSEEFSFEELLVSMRDQPHVNQVRALANLLKARPHTECRIGPPTKLVSIFEFRIDQLLAGKCPRSSSDYSPQGIHVSETGPKRSLNMSRQKRLNSLVNIRPRFTSRLVCSAIHRHQRCWSV